MGEWKGGSITEIIMRKDGAELQLGFGQAEIER